MAQKLNTFVAANENLSPEIESLIEFFDSVLNNEEFPTSAGTLKAGHDVLHIAIEAYRASRRHNSNMDLEKVRVLEPKLAEKIRVLEGLKGDSFVQLLDHVFDASNCFFASSLAFSGNSSTKTPKEQPSNSASQALAKLASELFPDQSR
jgi:hypothetical protein